MILLFKNAGQNNRNTENRKRWGERNQGENSSTGRVKAKTNNTNTDSPKDE